MSLRQSILTMAGILAISGALAFGPGSVAVGQDPNPDDYDFAAEASPAEVAPGGEFTVETFVNARADGGQGWSYGLAHDFTKIEIMSVTIEGTDAGSTISGGFEVTAISEDADTGDKLGFAQGIVLSFTQPIFVPIQDRFVMARATYQAMGDVCGDSNDPVPVDFEYSSELSTVVGGPAADINFTVRGQGVVPSSLSGATVTVACAGPPQGLTLSATPREESLIADNADTVMIDIELTRDEGDELGGEAWSYALTLDSTILAIEDFGIGEDAAAVKGGNGPDFEVHDPIDLDDDGTPDAVIGGAVVDFSKAQDSTLPLPTGMAQKIGLLTVRSAAVLDDPVETTLDFETIDGGDESTIENIVTINSQTVEPTLAGGALTVQPGDVPSGPFIRGDANDDTRVDIADGIWIIQFLFYGGMETQCLGAADANDDGLSDIADAMYIFNYRLQPGRRPGDLFPAPPAPFPGCGVDPDLTAEDCAPGGTQCDS